jgi:PAS domain S-box-containing protein
MMFLQRSSYWLLLTMGCLGVVVPLVLFLFLRWRKTDAKRVGEQYFSLLAEAIPQIVWTAIPGGGMDYCNQRLYELTGYSREESLGSAWQKLLHPDDLPLALQNWEASRQTGKSYEVEYRLRTAAGGYRWHLVRATPMRDSAGNIIKWFGACADIDDQMRHQQLLEEQIKQHTAAIMEFNNRLSSEMRERALAQQELNEQSERTVRELTKRSNRATNLIKMAELLQSCASMEDAFPVIAGMAPKVFPELRGALLLFNVSREVLDLAAIWTDCVLPPLGIGMQDCWALRSGRPHTVVAGDYTAECGHAANCQHSYLCLPLLSHGETVGLLHFQMIEPGEFPQPVLLMANMFAEQVSLSLANPTARRSSNSVDPRCSHRPL